MINCPVESYTSDEVYCRTAQKRPGYLVVYEPVRIRSCLKNIDLLISTLAVSSTIVLSIPLSMLSTAVFWKIICVPRRKSVRTMAQRFSRCMKYSAHMRGNAVVLQNLKLHCGSLYGRLTWMVAAHSSKSIRLLFVRSAAKRPWSLSSFFRSVKVLDTACNGAGWQTSMRDQMPPPSKRAAKEGFLCVRFLRRDLYVRRYGS